MRKRVEKPQVILTSVPAFTLAILSASVLASQRRFLSLAATLQVFLDQLVYLLM